MRLDALLGTNNSTVSYARWASALLLLQELHGPMARDPGSADFRRADIGHPPAAKELRVVPLRRAAGRRHFQSRSGAAHPPPGSRFRLATLLRVLELERGRVGSRDASHLFAWLGGSRWRAPLQCRRTTTRSHTVKPNLLLSSARPTEKTPQNPSVPVSQLDVVLGRAAWSTIFTQHVSIDADYNH